MTLIANVEKIKIARLRKGYSQAQLAEKIGLTVLAIQLIESGKTKTPRPSTVKKICDALELPISDIYVA